MQGTTLRKVGRVIAHLGFHPRYIVPYLLYGPLSTKGPLQLGVPWFALSAIEFLDSFVTASMHVFEYGAGGSTVYFAKRAKTVTTTEDSQQWCTLVQNMLADVGSANVDLQYRPFDFHNCLRFEQSEYLHSIPDRKFDVIVVDGSEEDKLVRPTCFYHAETRIARGGVIVVDDSWRYPQLRTRNCAKRHREFRSIGPCRPGVTSTDIFFY